jgi:hypothetical protein
MLSSETKLRCFASLLDSMIVISTFIRMWAQQACRIVETAFRADGKAIGALSASPSEAFELVWAFEFDGLFVNAEAFPTRILRRDDTKLWRDCSLTANKA